MGTLAFAVRRLPTAAMTTRWDRLAARAQAALQEETYLSFGLAAKPDTVTGNTRVLAHGRVLNEVGLLSEDEGHCLAALELFWATHPEAECGVWGEGYTIAPIE